MPNEDQVFVLAGSTARFIPQRDEEILGPANTRNTLTNPECRPRVHPRPDITHLLWRLRRSLVVFIDGACPANGPAALQASVGVYFGPESPKNISRLIDTSRPTNQLAEITAAVEAMRQVRSVVVPERRILLKGSSPRTTPDTLRDARRFRLVLATDSSYLVDCMCKYMPQWTFDNLNRVIATAEATSSRIARGLGY
ncbi:hypothetical protein H9L39_07955 [Fusarium oxysporum f. sp. albedinis]|nr:hypothetical protein H9L39_07955 [Fusarium oxysporum f. sp. albedinis]